MEAIKEKCRQRLDMQRKSLISKYRRETQEKQHLLSQSKLRPSHSVRQAHQELLDTDALHALILTEAAQQAQYDDADCPQLSVEEWNREIDFIHRELNEYLARELLLSVESDEYYHDERYHQITAQEAEQIQEMYHPQSGESHIYVCPVCKSTVHRIQNSTRLCCERRGCVDVDVRVPELRVDYIMDMVMKLLVEHRKQQPQHSHPCQEEHSMKVTVSSLSECGMCDPPVYDENGQWVSNNENDALAVFVSCTQCHYLDFETIM
ncbi:hypothetical protein FGO68_gene3554 [Halteria grandinella]|uniref:Uncharacterized protein n=1 Tax=Halteria grandinella TaxID=5974 RepID=A0A8J8SW93_HALGN|nr:hypothetical protein FGO68_gene3554 [Halteria grandinella]